MIDLALDIIYCLLIATVIGFLIGYLTGKLMSNNKKCVNSFIHPESNKQGNIYHKPFILSFPRPLGEDDLTLIEGLDEDTKDKLNGMGIFHLDQIAKWSLDNSKWVDNFLSLDRKPIVENWSLKAKELIQPSVKNSI